VTKIGELYTELSKIQSEINKLRVEHLLTLDLLDEGGYPTDAALTVIKIWDWSDSKGWFEFIKSIWWMPEWGWHEKEEDHDWDKDKFVYRYYISTGGWSGNESIINAMKEYTSMWHLQWYSSRRGGHYVFELKEFKDE
jgi:hypothetical protein